MYHEDIIKSSFCANKKPVPMAIGAGVIFIITSFL